jgi:hypothetical protein
MSRIAAQHDNENSQLILEADEMSLFYRRKLM